LVGQVPLFLKKKEFFWNRSYSLRKCAPALVYASVPLREKKSFFCFFFENCLYFCFTNTKKKRTRKKNLSLTVCASVPLREKLKLLVLLLYM
jgi:hypothetical protein